MVTNQHRSLEIWTKIVRRGEIPIRIPHVFLKNGETSPQDIGKLGKNV